jgi:hypothetical protein
MSMAAASTALRARNIGIVSEEAARASNMELIAPFQGG